MGCCPKNSLIMNRDSNSYTFIFATIMVLVVASTLAFTASSLKSLQADNVRKEKMQNILSTIGIKTDREKAEQLFKNYIKEYLRYVVILFFGLLHGLGFALVLSDIGYRSSDLLINLLSFNLGIEVAQISIVLVLYLLVALNFAKNKNYRIFLNDNFLFHHF